jgi:hypothetical protein
MPKSGKHRPPNGQRKNTRKIQQESSQADPKFHLIFYSTVSNLKRCYGCQSAFKAIYKRPPHDIIVKHFCHRTYKNVDGIVTRSKNLQTAYFHMNLNCMRKIVPDMELRDIIIHDDVHLHLSDGHRNVLSKFGLNL